jgi:alanine dehydrogenase
MDQKSNFVNFSRSEQFITQPETLEIKKQKAHLSIGVPKEIAFQETRIGLVPEAVAMLVNIGHTVFVESNAGSLAHFSDHEYSEAGAQIVYSPAEAYQADFIIKVAPPLSHEIEKIKSRATLFSALNLPAQTDEYFKRLIAKKSTAISYEHIKDRTNSYPVIRSLSEIVGNTSIYIAADYLCSSDYGMAKSLGGFSGIAPAEIVILGAGTVGEFAARAAIGMGAEVKIFDNSIYKLRNIQNNINQRLFTSIIQHNVLAKTLKTADVVIGALHSAIGETPMVITEDMVRQMKQGSVIIDVSIVNGGVCETSHITNHTHPVFKKHGVTHYCVPNISSKVPRTASYALSNFFSTVLLKIAEEGGIENYLKIDSGIRLGTYLYNGILTNKYISELFNISCQDIDLLMFPYH